MIILIITYMSIRRSGGKNNRNNRGNRSTSRKSVPMSSAGLMSQEEQLFKKTQFELAQSSDAIAWHQRHFLYAFAGASSLFVGSSIEYLRRRWLAKRAGYIDKNGEVSVLAWEDGLNNDKKAHGSLIAKIPYTDVAKDMFESMNTNLNEKRLAQEEKQRIKKMSKSSSMLDDIPRPDILMKDFLFDRTSESRTKSGRNVNDVANSVLGGAMVGALVGTVTSYGQEMGKRPETAGDSGRGINEDLMPMDEYDAKVDAGEPVQRAMEEKIDLAMDDDMGELALVGAGVGVGLGLLNKKDKIRELMKKNK